MRSALFPAMAAVAAAAAIDPKLTRTFAGDGTPYLPVPGCKKVTEVRVGGLIIPEQHKQSFPGDVDAKTSVNTEWPLWELAKGEDGTPVLVRSVQSNDGIWQNGVTITVTGEWEPEPKPSEGEQTPPGPSK